MVKVLEQQVLEHAAPVLGELQFRIYVPEQLHAIENQPQGEFLRHATRGAETETKLVPRCMVTARNRCAKKGVYWDW